MQFDAVDQDCIATALLCIFITFSAAISALQCSAVQCSAVQCSAVKTASCRSLVKLVDQWYCIAAMLRNGISAHALNSTPAQCVSLRFVHHVALVHLLPKQKLLDC